LIQLAGIDILSGNKVTLGNEIIPLRNAPADTVTFCIHDQQPTLPNDPTEKSGKSHSDGTREPPMTPSNQWSGKPLEAPEQAHSSSTGKCGDLQSTAESGKAGKFTQNAQTNIPGKPKEVTSFRGKTLPLSSRQRREAGKSLGKSNQLPDKPNPLPSKPGKGLGKSGKGSGKSNQLTGKSNQLPGKLNQLPGKSNQLPGKPGGDLGKNFYLSDGQGKTNGYRDESDIREPVFCARDISIAPGCEQLIPVRFNSDGIKLDSNELLVVCGISLGSETPICVANCVINLDKQVNYVKAINMTHCSHAVSRNKTIGVFEKGLSVAMVAKETQSTEISAQITDPKERADIILKEADLELGHMAEQDVKHLQQLVTKYSSIFKLQGDPPNTLQICRA